VTDLFDRWLVGPDKRTITGYGLRGGSWKAVGYENVTFTLKQVKLFDDLPVSGTVTWAEDGEVRTSLTARGRRVALEWNDWTHPTLSTQERLN
jgi:hypothetical protein